MWNRPYASTSSTKLGYFGPIGKRKRPPLLQISWTGLTWRFFKGNHVLKVLYWVFFLHQSENKDGRPDLWWGHFRLLCNPTEFHKSHVLRIVLCQVDVFWVDWKTQVGRPCLWLDYAFWTFRPQPFTRFQRSLTGSKCGSISYLCFCIIKINDMWITRRTRVYFYIIIIFIIIIICTCTFNYAYY